MDASAGRDNKYIFECAKKLFLKIMFSIVTFHAPTLQYIFRFPFRFVFKSQSHITLE